MIVQCPACKTTYTVADNLVKIEKPTFRCSRCKHIFAVTGFAELNRAEEPSYQEIPPEPEERELSFSFEAKKEPKELAPDSFSTEPELSFDSVHGAEDRGESWSLTSAPTEEQSSKDSQQVRPEAVQTGSSAATPQQSAFDQNWWAPGGRQNGNPDAAELSVAPYLTLAALLVLFFSMVTLVYSSQPAYLDALLNRRERPVRRRLSHQGRRIHRRRADGAGSGRRPAAVGRWTGRLRRETCGLPLFDGSTTQECKGDVQ
jgi:predicted Zn finger-like uncharacterized protein